MANEKVKLCEKLVIKHIRLEDGSSEAWVHFYEDGLQHENKVCDRRAVGKGADFQEALADGLDKIFQD